ncbi:hypothetical protein DT23_12745 [Thioclava indica]|uniref:Uncharacterized protein n=1 Tax=Thioclava indica TaxID=1353528 RepID=A0A074JW59_9RHOB|nr:hypothetical protein DT23_12745 [Thioclava indica]
MAGFYANKIKGFAGQLIKEMLAQRASLKTDARNCSDNPQ